MKAILDTNVLSLSSDKFSDAYHYLLKISSLESGLVLPSAWLEYLDAKINPKAIFDRLSKEINLNIDKVLSCLREGLPLFVINDISTKQEKHVSISDFCLYAKEKSLVKINLLGKKSDLKSKVRTLIYQAIYKQSSITPSQWAEHYWALKIMSFDAFWELVSSDERKHDFIMESWEYCVKYQIPSSRIFSRINSHKNLQFNENRELLEDDAIWHLLMGYHDNLKYENVSFITVENKISERISKLSDFISEYVPYSLIPNESRILEGGLFIFYNQIDGSFKQQSCKMINTSVN